MWRYHGRMLECSYKPWGMNCNWPRLSVTTNAGRGCGTWVRAWYGKVCCAAVIVSYGKVTANTRRMCTGMVLDAYAVWQLPQGDCHAGVEGNTNSTLRVLLPYAGLRSLHEPLSRVWNCNAGVDGSTAGSDFVAVPYYNWFNNVMTHLKR